MTNYEKYYGSPEKVVETFDNLCKECSRYFNRNCPCDECMCFGLPGFVTAPWLPNIEWLKMDKEVPEDEE